jgi:tetrahydromethanopterin S-methyltransferase subunit G
MDYDEDTTTTPPAAHTITYTMIKADKYKELISNLEEANERIEYILQVGNQSQKMMNQQSAAIQKRNERIKNLESQVSFLQDSLIQIRKQMMLKVFQF